MQSPSDHQNTQGNVPRFQMHVFPKDPRHWFRFACNRCKIELTFNIARALPIDRPGNIHMMGHNCSSCTHSLPLYPHFPSFSFYLHLSTRAGGLQRFSFEFNMKWLRCIQIHKTPYPHYILIVDCAVLFPTLKYNTIYSTIRSFIQIG